MTFPLLIVSLFHDEMNSNIIIYMKVVKAALSPMTWWLAARITWTMPIGSFGESVDWYVMQNDALAHVESEFSFLLPIPVASKSITWASFHVGFTIRGILCQVHDHMYCWEPLFPWYCADTELRIRHNLGWVRKVTCQRSLELGFQKVTLEFLGLIRKIIHLPLGRNMLWGLLVDVAEVRRTWLRFFHW